MRLELVESDCYLSYSFVVMIQLVTQFLSDLMNLKFDLTYSPQIQTKELEGYAAKFLYRLTDCLNFEALSFRKLDLFLDVYMQAMSPRLEFQDQMLVFLIHMTIILYLTSRSDL